jgi:hypothetical protein
MANKVKNAIYFVVNILRIIIGIVFLFACLSDLYGIGIDPDIYEKVYTGEFLGKYSYVSLSHLKIVLWIESVIAFVYLVIVVLHITKLKFKYLIIIVLTIIDLVVIVYYCSLHYLYSI